MDEERTERITDDSEIIIEEPEIKISSDSAPEQKAPTGKQKIFLNIYDLASVFVSAFIIIALIFTFIFRLVGVIGQSMENTVHEGDWLITVQKDEYVLGDIVVITQPNYFNEPLIKRVIATSGQTVNIDFTTSTVYVDGNPLTEPYTKEDYILPKYDDISFPYTVPEGSLFCMGDNRNNSTDCRSTIIGPIDERYILGRASVRLVPFGDFDIYNYE